MNLNGRTINPGELRTVVTFEKRTVSVETGGFQTATWSVIGERWVRWENVHGSEVWAAESLEARRPATVLGRYHADIDETCSIVLGRSSRMTEAERDAARYEIVSLDDIAARHEYVEFKVMLMRAS